MVLKKSNTIFNSGATQKCLSRGRFLSSRPSSGALLSFKLEGIPSYEKNTPTDALQKIYDYLGFPGLGSKLYQELNKNHYYKRTYHSIVISLNKQQLWLIPDRIDKLVKEKNFLEGDQREGFDEIHIQKGKNLANLKKIYKRESCVLKVNNEEDTAPEVSERVTKQRPQRRSRGLQRHHLLTAPVRNEDENHRDYEPQTRRVVKIEFEEKDHVDARLLQHREMYYVTRDRWKPKKRKKGCVNGKGSYHCRNRMYNPPQLRNEIREIMELGIDDYYDNLFDEKDDELVEDCENYYYRDCNSGHFCDYLITCPEYITPVRKRKIRKSQRNKKASVEQLVSVNSASSKSTIKYPKGSFQIIERPNDVYDDENCIVSSENNYFVHVQKDDFGELHIYNAGSTPHRQDVIDLPITGNSFEGHDNFVVVNIRFPKDIQDFMNDLLQHSNGYNTFVNDYSVTFGNCFPPVFSVDLEQTESRLTRGWSLVGTSWSDMSCDKDFKWEVTLKCSKSHIIDSDKVRNKFVSNIHLRDRCDFPFYDLVHIAMASLELASSYLLDENIVLVPKKEDMSVSNCYNTAIPEVCSVDEAVRRLRDDGDTILQTSESATHLNSSVLQVKRESVECDICLNTCDKHGQKDSGIITLLPCRHSFCHECWGSHIFYQTMRGENEIICMYMECKQVINETLMKSLIPEMYFAKVHSQRLERHIDQSSLCQWCPASKCNRVAIIAEQSQYINQFGCPVVCDCNRRYCFSCQSTIHWPMSCNQAAAYSKLLYKLGDAMLENVIFNIDLKPCPGCKYPIEKNEGCPHMTCRMCGFNFCWKCLQSTAQHRVWRCNVDEKSTFVTYQLHNEVINNFPLEFFTKAIRMRKKHKSVKKLNKTIPNAFKRLDNKKMKFPFKISLQMEDKMVKSEVIRLATATVSFLTDSYLFLEYFLLLFSFSLLNNKSSRGKSSHDVIRNLLDRLLFTVSRLEMLVVGRSPRQVFIYGKTSQMHLDVGHQLMERLKVMVPSVQKRSKNVLTEPIGELDPRQFLRYK